jgi:hypothetical protein
MEVADFDRLGVGQESLGGHTRAGGCRLLPGISVDFH